MTNDEVISVLNGLIETCKDGDEGFRTCALDASDTRLKTFFTNRAQSCAAAARELQSLVHAYGGDPGNSSSLGSAVHRRWIDIKALITGKDDRAVLQECERGEAMAVSSYSQALTRKLPENVRVVVERQYQGVLQNHDQVKSLRDQYRA